MKFKTSQILNGIQEFKNEDLQKRPDDMTQKSSAQKVEVKSTMKAGKVHA